MFKGVIDKNSKIFQKKYGYGYGYGYGIFIFNVKLI